MRGLEPVIIALIAWARAVPDGRAELQSEFDAVYDARAVNHPRRRRRSRGRRRRTAPRRGCGSSCTATCARSRGRRRTSARSRRARAAAASSPRRSCPRRSTCCPRSSARARRARSGRGSTPSATSARSSTHAATRCARRSARRSAGGSRSRSCGARPRASGSATRTRSRCTGTACGRSRAGVARARGAATEAGAVVWRTRPDVLHRPCSTCARRRLLPARPRGSARVVRPGDGRRQGRQQIGAGRRQRLHELGLLRGRRRRAARGRAARARRARRARGAAARLLARRAIRTGWGFGLSVFNDSRAARGGRCGRPRPLRDASPRRVRVRRRRRAVRAPGVRARVLEGYVVPLGAIVRAKPPGASAARASGARAAESGAAARRRRRRGPVRPRRARARCVCRKNADRSELGSAPLGVAKPWIPSGGLARCGETTPLPELAAPPTPDELAALAPTRREALPPTCVAGDAPSPPRRAACRRRERRGRRRPGAPALPSLTSSRAALDGREVAKAKAPHRWQGRRAVPRGTGCCCARGQSALVKAACCTKRHPSSACHHHERGDLAPGCLSCPRRGSGSPRRSPSRGR